MVLARCDAGPVMQADEMPQANFAAYARERQASSARMLEEADSLIRRVHPVPKGLGI